MLERRSTVVVRVVDRDAVRLDGKRAGEVRAAMAPACLATPADAHLAADAARLGLCPVGPRCPRPAIVAYVGRGEAGRTAVKFIVTYRERRADADPAAAGRRVARSLNERPMPPGLKVHQLLSRIGGGGGFAVVETAEAEDLQHLASLFAAYECRIEPVADVAFNGAVRAEASPSAAAHGALPEMPPGEPHEGAFSDDDVYDTED